MKTNLPPGPNVPGLLTTIRWQRDLAKLMETSGARYGDVWTMRLMGGTNFVMVSDPALLEVIFTSDESVLAYESSLAKPLLGEHSVIVLRGAAHARARRMLAPLFERARVQRYHGAIAQIAEQELETWPLNEPVSLLPHLRTITLNVMLTMIFGTADGAAQEQIRTRMRALLAWGASTSHMVLLQAMFMRGGGVPKGFEERRDALRAVLREQVERTRADARLEERDDILALLVRERDDDGEALTDTELVDHLMTLLIQGHQSSANLLAWAFERVLRHPEVLERLRAEIAAAGSDDYLDAVVKETLRVRPPQPLTTRRVVNAPFRLGGYDLEPGTIVAVNIYMTHRRADRYPEPARFRPERFLENPPGRYEWVPFGGGDHSCFGAGLALDETRIILRTIFRRIRLEAADPHEERIIRRAVGLSPGDGARVVVRERLPATAEAVLA